MRNVVIVGGGISGLATAYWIKHEAALRRGAIRTTVLESASRPGGRVWTDRVDGFQVEAGATSFLDSKQTTLSLCRSIGLTPELITARPEAKNRYILLKNR